jgi:mannosylglucosylglycerate synthase
MEYYRSLREMRDQLGLEQEARFIFETGPDPKQPYTIEADLVGELYRLADLLFMPSHREGFGMPILEAGLAGIPVFSAPVPAALEIGGSEIHIFSASDSPQDLAGQILEWAVKDPTYQLRKRVRQHYTWQAIFQTQIEPLLHPMLGGT